VELREEQDIYYTYISNLSCDCNSRQRTAHCEAYFSVSCWLGKGFFAAEQWHWKISPETSAHTL